MKRYISYFLVLCSFLFANCTNVAEGFDSTEVIVVSADNLKVSFEGETAELNISSMCTWNIKSSEGWIWISPSIKEGKKGNTNVKLVFSENTSTSERVATLTFENNTYDVSQEVVIVQQASEPFVEVSTEDISIEAEGTKTVVVSSNVSWTASCNDDWVSLSTSKGEVGETSVEVSFEANVSTYSRDASIVIANKEHGLKKTIKVKQGAFEPSVEVSESVAYVPTAGATKNISITSNITWYATCDQDWVTLSAANGAEGTSTLAITVDPSASIDDRSATVSIYNNRYGINRTISVHQVAFVPELAVSTEAIESSVQGLNRQVTVNSNISWYATCDEDWVTVTPANGVGGTSTLAISVAQNATTQPRSAVVNVVNTEYGLTRIITVSQTAFTPELSVSTESISTSMTGGARELVITSNVPWTAGCEVDWVTLSSVSGNGGTSYLTVTMAVNTITEQRSTVLYISNSEYDITREITISQAAFAPALEVTNPNVRVDNLAGTTLVELYANVDYEVSVDVDWLSAEVVAGGLNISYSTNTETNANRSATITLHNEEHGLTQVINVTQSAMSSNNFIVFTTTDNAVVIPNNVDAFGANIVSITYGNGRGVIAFDGPITTIGSNAFKNCDNLSSITIPSTVTSIGESAFYYCTSLSNVIIPDTVTSIGSSAFYYCTSMTSITIPSSVTSIGSSAFYYCTGELVLSGSLASKDYSSSSYPSYSSNYWLYGNRFTSLVIGEGVTQIGSYAFRNCSNLTNVTIPDTVTSIGSNAFYNCDGLTTIRIPSSVTSIGSSAFYECSYLRSVYVAATEPPAYYSSAFNYNASGRIIYVPYGCLEEYQSSWYSYSSYIQETPYTPTECTSLTITADDVDGRATTTTIHYTAVTNGVDEFGEEITGVVITGSVESEAFPQNMSETDTVERTITYTYLGQTATTTITQGVYVAQYYTINLNDEWRMSTVLNPDSSMYEGVYESYSNLGVNNSTATMYIDIYGYDTFELYVRSYAESSYDYVTVSFLDNTSVKTSTSGNQKSGTALSNYTRVTYTGIGGGSHRITIVYLKDVSQSYGDDRGYVLIPKNQ